MYMSHNMCICQSTCERVGLIGRCYPTRDQNYIVIDDNMGDNFRFTPSHGPSVIKIKNIVTVIFRHQYRSPGRQNRSIQDWLRISDRTRNTKILDWLLPGPSTTVLEVCGK